MASTTASGTGPSSPGSRARRRAAFQERLGSFVEKTERLELRITAGGHGGSRRRRPHLQRVIHGTGGEDRLRSTTAVCVAVIATACAAAARDRADILCTAPITERQPLDKPCPATRDRARSPS